MRKPAGVVALVAAASLGLGTAAHASVANSNQSQAKSVSVAVNYTGGHGGTAKSNETPIEIGWANLDKFAPVNTPVVKAAFSFINQYLDGVDGHPLELVQPKICSLTISYSAHEGPQGTQCGRALLSNPRIHVVMLGDDESREDKLLTVLDASKRVVVVGGAIQSFQALRAPNAYFFSATDFEIVNFLVLLKNYLHAKSVAQVWPNLPGITGDANAFATMLHGIGVRSTGTALIPLAPMGGKDVVTPLKAANPSTASAVFFSPGAASQCVGLAQAMKMLHLTSTPVMETFTTCGSQAVESALGDFPHPWIFEAGYPNVNIADPTGQVGTMMFALKKYAGRSWLTEAQGINAPHYFGLAISLDKWLKQLGANDITGQSVGKTIRSYKGAMFLGPSSVKFGVQPLPTVGSIAERFSEYLGHGQWKYLTPWISGPLSALPKGFA